MPSRIPLEQGLRLTGANAYKDSLLVTSRIPLEQGLRPVAAQKRETMMMPLRIPLEQGLRPLSLSRLAGLSAAAAYSIRTGN